MGAYEMADEFNIFHASWTGGLTVVAALFGFVGKRFISRVDSIEDDLRKHKLEDVSKYATTDALTRVHDRIDASIRTAEDNFRELRTGISEIKTLLIQGGQQ
jgi:hypothetical protein